VQGTTSWTSKYSTTNSYNITGILANTTYEYHVETYCSLSGSSNSGYTTVQTFTTTMRVGSASVAATEIMSMYPNPASDEVMFQYSLPQSTQLCIKVFDMNGKEIQTVLCDYIEEGNYTLTINTAQFAKGIYIVKMISGFGINLQRLMVQ